jgi:co-chaperonin GroES (HSP10)
MKLINDQIMVKMTVDITTESGIILPEIYQKKDEGVVVRVGNKVKHCKVGDTVTKFFSCQGEPYEEEGVKYLILSEKKDIEFVDSKDSSTVIELPDGTTAVVTKEQSEKLDCVTIK